jgi:ElaB/YqjD/DUF883 family membrane-anchored ribosome-binding protein
MGKDKASDKAGDYVQRELEQPVQKVVDEKLNDPFIATKKGEKDATEVLQEGVAKSLKSTEPTMQTAKSYPRHDSDPDRDQTTGGLASQVAETASEYATKAGEKLDHVYDSSREAGERIQEVGGNIKSALDKSVQDQPMATLAVVGALGLVLGALWKS